MKYTMRHLRSWMRSPRHYFNKTKTKLFGIDADFFNNNKRESYPIGSMEWLALTEMLYGGLQIGGVNSKTNQGGDRMSPHHHGYGECYQEFLRPFISPIPPQQLTLVEVGILNGSGLAIWCDLFPNARIIGFDIDLSNFHANRQNLIRKGAFRKNQPEVHSFDQLDAAKTQNVLRDILRSNRVDIVIDDGCHSKESVEIKFGQMQPYLANKFVYFIEDNFDTYDWLAHRYREFYWATRGEIAVATNK
jgi:hypothetical protein